MRKDVQGMVLLLLGITVLRLSVGDQYLFYVAEGMRPFLIASAVGLLVFGGFSLWDGWRGNDDESVVDVRQAEPAAAQVHRHDASGSGHMDGLQGDLGGTEPVADGDHADNHAHDHSSGPRVAYLLLLPVLAVFVVAPSALGSFSAGRQQAGSAAPAAGLELPALRQGEVNDLSLRDYVIRAVWDDGSTLRDQQVRMVGFVTPDPAGGWWLTRMAMACCAADAQASRIKVLDAEALPADTWVELTGAWVEGGGVRDPKAIPIIEATTVRTVPTPRKPYE